MIIIASHLFVRIILNNCMSPFRVYTPKIDHPPSGKTINKTKPKRKKYLVTVFEKKKSFCFVFVYRVSRVTTCLLISKLAVTLLVSSVFAMSNFVAAWDNISSDDDRDVSFSIILTYLGPILFGEFELDDDSSPVVVCVYGDSPLLLALLEFGRVVDPVVATLTVTGFKLSFFIAADVAIS